MYSWIDTQIPELTHWHSTPYRWHPPSWVCVCTYGGNSLPRWGHSGWWKQLTQWHRAEVAGGGADGRRSSDSSTEQDSFSFFTPNPEWQWACKGEPMKRHSWNWTEQGKERSETSQTHLLTCIFLLPRTWLVLNRQLNPEGRDAFPPASGLRPSKSMWVSLLEGTQLHVLPEECPGKTLEERKALSPSHEVKAPFSPCS